MTIRHEYERLHRFYRRYGPRVGRSLITYEVNSGQTLVKTGHGHFTEVDFSIVATQHILASFDGPQYALQARYQANRYLNRLQAKQALQARIKALPHWYHVEVAYWRQMNDELSCTMSRAKRKHLAELIRDQAMRLHYWRTVQFGLPSALD